MHILITGGAGHVASIYRAHVGTTHTLRLFDLRPVANPAPHEAIIGTLTDREAVRAACQGIDAVIHLGADPRIDAPFHESLVDNNYVATQNVFAAAREAGCKRVIFASSTHTTGGIPDEQRGLSEDVICPGNLYGVSKCYGEALASYFAAVEGLSVICLRIGWAAPTAEMMREPGAQWWTSVYFGPRDVCQLFDKALATDVHFGIFNASSDNANNRHDLSRTRGVLGYEPQDRVEDVLG